jgi:hypothetical protein
VLEAEYQSIFGSKLANWHSVDNPEYGLDIVERVSDKKYTEDGTPPSKAIHRRWDRRN